MGNSQTTRVSGGGSVSFEEIGAHILNADPALKQVTWPDKQLYARRALEHARKEHLQGGTNRALDPFWDKIKGKLSAGSVISVAPEIPRVVAPNIVEASTTISEHAPRKRSQLFLERINEPKVKQPTMSELGLSGGGGGNTSQCVSEEEDTSSEEEDCDDE